MIRPEELDAALLAIVSLYSRLGPLWETLRPAYDSRHKWISDYVLALVAGHESVAYLIATVLLNAGDELRTANSDADYAHLTRLVVEGLRYDSPVQLLGRRVSAETHVNGHVLRAGDRVFLHVGCANRDPRLFSEPEVFNPLRSGPPALSFGAGRCQCVGRSLAIREAILFLATLANRSCAVQIAHERVRWNNGLAGRGFRTLPAVVRLTERHSGAA
jgi:cytochrome P450